MRYAMVLLSLLLTSGLAQAQDCSQKEVEIQRQLENAREHRNSGRIRGLEAALKSVQENCTNSDLRTKRQHAIDDARNEVAERKADLQEAIDSGSAEKIKIRQHKLAEAQEELRDALRE